MSRSGDEDFLRRWSARKLRARVESVAEPEAAPPPAAATPAAQLPAEVVPERSDVEILEELGLPHPDSLVKGDNFKAFLAAGIPARLRARALRRLWVSDPVLANLDGLNDYEQDFTDKATVQPDLKTAYRVGKGFLRQPPDSAAAESTDPSLPSGETPSGETPSTETQAGDAIAAAEGSPAPGQAQGTHAESEAGAGYNPARPALADDVTRQAAAATARPRRMRFRFDG